MLQQSVMDSANYSWRSSPAREERDLSPAPYKQSSYRERAPSARYEPPYRRYDNPRRDYEQSRAPKYEPPHFDYYPRERDSQSQRTCRYCKEIGHDIHECRKREINNARRSGNEPTLPQRNGPRREVLTQVVQNVESNSEKATLESQV